MMSTQTLTLIAIAGMLTFAVLVILVSSRRRPSDLEQHIRAIPRLEAKLDLLLKHGGVRYEPPYKNLSPAIVDAIRRNSKIEAIKLYREATGVGLKEAKDYIEEVMRRGGV